MGNCVPNCSNGYFENTKICKCSNAKCLNCSLKSLSYDLCISCNIEKGYFPKFNDTSNVESFINCYKEPEGYFLSNNAYHECYPTCKKCNNIGSEENHNYIECYPNYVLINDSQRNNCNNQSINIDKLTHITEIEQLDDISTIVSIIYINLTDEITSDVNILYDNLTNKD